MGERVPRRAPNYPTAGTDEGRAHGGQDSKGSASACRDAASHSKGCNAAGGRSNEQR